MSSGLSVLVTGGSGFIGLHLVSELLQAGYKVNTTTRSLQSEAAEPLKLLQKQHPINLKIYEADLLVPGSFKPALAGVTTVFHVATPVLIGRAYDNPEQQLRPAVEGTRGLLQSCLEFNTIKTIIVTSSIYTIKDPSKPLDYIYSEKDFYKADREPEPYVKAKVLAEQEVWQFQEKHSQQFRIITIHPGLTLGPDIKINFVLFENPRSHSGKNIPELFFKGKGSSIKAKTLPIVDVRDVALAHIKANECLEAKGRFIICYESISILDLAKKFKEKIPFDITHVANDIPIYQPHNFDTRKSREVLGLQYRDWSTIISDTVAYYKS